MKWAAYHVRRRRWEERMSEPHPAPFAWLPTKINGWVYWLECPPWRRRLEKETAFVRVWSYEHIDTKLVATRTIYKDYD